MLNNDRKWMELTYSLLFSLPGTPVLRYGDEIGMGDDLGLPERNSVRTAMQWSNEKHAGFSAHADGNLPIPIISDGTFGYHNVNVHEQMRTPNSLLDWMERAISVRKECMEFGWGDYELIDTNNDTVLAHCCHWKNGYAIAIHNLSGRECSVSLDLKHRGIEHLVECFSDQPYEAFEGDGKSIRIGPFGYRWFRKSTLFL
jgi:maltose alpha-D-glucosyltransferase/alpha-amylase